MFKVNVSENIFEGVLEKTLIFSLALLQLPLLVKTFNLVNSYLAFAMTAYDEEILVLFQPLNVDTSYWVSFY